MSSLEGKLAKEQEADLKLLYELLSEQEDRAVEKAKADKAGISATWMAKGEVIVLLVVKKLGSKIEKKRFGCKIFRYEKEEI